VTNSRSDESTLPFRLFFDSSNDAMFVIPLASGGVPLPFLDVNAQASHLTGYSREEMLTLSPLDIAENVDMQQWRTVIETLQRVGEASLKAALRKKNGKVLHLELSVRQVQLDGTDLAIAVGRDISGRVESEYALRETERDLTALINAHPESVILTTFDSTVVRCNRSAAERFGMTPDQLQGQRLIDLSSAQNEPGRREVMRQISSSNQPIRFQDFRDGMRLDNTVTPIGNSAGRARVAIFSRDVSAQYVRVEVENLLGDIDRRILKGSDIDSAARHACDRLAHVFNSPWVTLQSISGTPLKSRHFGGVLGESVDLEECLPKRDMTNWSDAEENLRIIELDSLPAHLGQIFRSHNCEQLAEVPIAFSKSQSAALVIALHAKSSFRGSDVLDLLDHVASRLRVAWGKTRELGKLSLLRQALEHSSTAVVLATLRGRIVWCNRAISDSVGTSQENLLGRQTREFLVDTAESTLVEMDRTLREGKTWTGECDMRRADGSTFTALQSVSPVYEEGAGTPSHVIIIQEDITDHKQSQARIRYLAEHDALTGLKNRAALMSQIVSILADGRRSTGQLALLYLDIDRFKAVNDTHGHGVGDQLLVEFAARLRQLVREDDIVARLGGDEFVIVLRKVDSAEKAGHIAQKLLDRAAEPICCDGLELKVGTSIGIVLLADLSGSKGPLEATDLLRAGDHAMYQAKQSGRNRYVFANREHIAALR